MTGTVSTLNRIYAAIDYMSNLENQDTMMVLEMSQQMISDVINAGEIKPMIDYVKRYCDVIDGPEDAQRIADDIVSGDGTDDADSQYSPGWHGTEVTSRGRVDYIDARSAYPNVAACETHLVIDCDAEECQPEHTKTGDSQ